VRNLKQIKPNEMPVKYDYFNSIKTYKMIEFLNVFTMLIADIPDDEFSDDARLKYVFDTAVESAEVTPRDAGMALRGAICNNKVGPSIFAIMKVLGKDDVRRRIFNARNA